MGQKMKTGAKNLITDVPGLRVGNADDHHLKSGVTILTADQPFMAGISIMGGAPGTREIALLDPDKGVNQIDAIVLSGGSAFGLDAAGGVMAGLRAAGRGFAVDSARVPIVPAAILFDLLNNGDKNWDENPYPALGRTAYDNASNNFAIGTAGAGVGAIAGDVKGGLGSASVILESGVTVAALVAVNALGSPLIEGKHHFWAAPWEIKDEFGGLGLPQDFNPLKTPRIPKLAQGSGGNTTIAIVATDAPLDKAGCQRLATVAHDGMGRALVPAHTPFDGDLVFGISTRSWQDEVTAVDIAMIGHAASICLTRAIARGVYEADHAEDDPYPAFSKF
jgi:D-aminopeptidase